ncbi:MAG: hypothetical protein L3J35_08660 [Bacteroidales bacterium]|nr:hypothetical protein [Bacteroidales bacterium]
MRIIFTIIFLILNLGIISAQSSFSAGLLTVSTHPFAEQNLPLHQNSFDNKGYVTFEPGIIMSYDRFLIKNLSFRATTAVMNDRFNLLSGYSQVLLRYKLFKHFKHSLYFGVGSAIFYDTDKTSIENFVNEDNYIIGKNAMYKIGWLSGMVEYNYYLSKKVDLAITLNHSHSRSLAISFGVRIDIPDPNGKGCDCPSFR